MNGQTGNEIYPGLEVGIVLKEDQRTGNITYGIVKDILTNSSFSPSRNKSPSHNGTSRQGQDHKIACPTQ